jgi:cysteine synthase
LKVAETIEEGVIVTLFPDGGDKYLSDRFWDE